MPPMAQQGQMMMMTKMMTKMQLLMSSLGLAIQQQMCHEAPQFM